MMPAGSPPWWVLAVGLLVLWSSSVPPVTAALTYDEYSDANLGHTRDTSGTFSFGDLPPDSDAHPNVTKEEMVVVFQGFSQFAKAIVDSVQTQKFPFDLLRRMMTNSFSESEVVSYQTNIIVTCAVTAIFILVLIIVMIAYTVFYWKNRKKNRYKLKKQLFDQVRARIIMIVGFCLGIANLGFLACSLMVSMSTNSAMLALDADVTGAMDGVSGYFNQSGEQWDFMSNDTNIWSLITVLQSDVNDIGTIIWQPAVQDFTPDLSYPFAATANLDSELAQAVTYLSDMQNQINSILSGTGGSLTTIMSEIYYNLTFARDDSSCYGCNGSCSDCANIVKNDIYFNMDFTTLSNVTSNLESLQALTATTVSNSMISPQYYFWRGIGDYIETQTAVKHAMANLNESLEAYSTSISNATSEIITPDESALKFDRLRGDWSTWYQSASGQDSARLAFHLVFGVINFVMLMVLYFGWALLFKQGLVKLNSKDDNFKLPRRIILICLITGLFLSIGYLCLAIAGFYAAANTEKAVCQPARDGSIINEADHAQNVELLPPTDALCLPFNAVHKGTHDSYAGDLDLTRDGLCQLTLDYVDAIPGHPGLYVSSIMLGNGSLYPLYATDIFEACRSNNTTSYSTFRQDLLEPNMYSDLSYAQFFVNETLDFNTMLVSLPNVTLIPPLFETWVSDFTAAAFFNFTEFEEFLTRGVIDANLTTYVNNLLTIYNHPTDGPIEPALSRLNEVAQKLLEQENDLNAMTTLKNNVYAAFTSYSTLVNNMLSNVTGANSSLAAAEPDLQAASAGFISTGVNEHRVNFLAQLLAIQNQSQTWVTEVGPCKPLANAYDQTLDSFCNKYSDNANATWILVGHTVFFLLLLSLTSFLLFLEIPQVSEDDMEEDLDIKREFPKLFGHRSACCCYCVCCCVSKSKRKKKYGDRAQSSGGHSRRRLSSTAIVAPAVASMAPMATTIKSNKKTKRGNNQNI